jgi:hypothetical protein
MSAVLVPFRPTVYLISIRRQAMPLLHPGDTFP